MDMNRTILLRGTKEDLVGQVSLYAIWFKNSILFLGPVYMWKNTSPARPGADRRGNFQSLFT